MKRIALAGPYSSGKTLLSLTLSEILNIPRAHVENISFLYKNIFHEDKDPSKYNISDLLSMGLARFHSRIKEEGADSFISDGSVINELAYGKARLSIENKKKNKISLKTILFGKVYLGFSKRLERTIIDYGKKNYDIIYYLIPDNESSSGSNVGNKFRTNFEKYFLDILDANDIPYKILRGNIESFAISILSDINKELLTNEDLKKIISEMDIRKKEFEKDFHFGDS